MALEIEKGDQDIDWNNDEEIYERIETKYWNYVEH
jgi:hypothetical protein